MKYGRKDVEIRISDCSGGENKVDSPTKIGKNQVVSAIDVQLGQKSTKRRPGTKRFNSQGTSGWMGIHSHTDLSGNNYLYGVNGTDLYDISLTADSMTKLYGLGGEPAEADFTKYLGQSFVCNGNKNAVIVNNTLAGQLGISAPTGVTARQIFSGGSLGGNACYVYPGTYTMYACYAIRDALGDIVLYSPGQLIGSIVVDGDAGNNEDAIAVENFLPSSDPRVTDRVIFSTIYLDAAHTTMSTSYYRVMVFKNNLTTTIPILQSTSGYPSVSFNSSTAICLGKLDDATAAAVSDPVSLPFYKSTLYGTYNEDTYQPGYGGSGGSYGTDLLIPKSRGSLAASFTYAAYCQATSSTNYDYDGRVLDTINYAIVAVNNTVPPSFSYILAFAGRLWGANSNKLYYSLKSTGNVYDLDRFEALSVNTYPYKIIGIFSLAEHMYLNTENGLIRVPYGDPYSEYEHVEKQFYFKFPKSVREYGGYLWGVTQDGFRSFDGTRMSSQDYSKSIKTDMEIMYAGAAEGGFQPCAEILRRSDRTEYHLSYRDQSVGTRTMNRKKILNLDGIAVDSTTGKTFAPWETATVGACCMAIMESGELISGQSAPLNSSDADVLYKLDYDSCTDKNVYIGNTLTASNVPMPYIKTATFVPSLRGKTLWEQIRLLGTFTDDVIIKLYIADTYNLTTTTTIEPASQSVFGTAVFDTSTFTSTEFGLYKEKLDKKKRGYAMYLEIYQTEEDKSFDIVEVMASGVLSINRYS